MSNELAHAMALLALAIAFGFSLEQKAELWAFVLGATLLLGSCSTLGI